MCLLHANELQLRHLFFRSIGFGLGGEKEFSTTLQQLSQQKNSLYIRDDLGIIVLKAMLLAMLLDDTSHIHTEHLIPEIFSRNLLRFLATFKLCKLVAGASCGIVDRHHFISTLIKQEISIFNTKKQNFNVT